MPRSDPAAASAGPVPVSGLLTVFVRVKVGVHELNHWRMLNWTAVVGTESGTFKILDTRPVT